MRPTDGMNSMNQIPPEMKPQLNPNELENTELDSRRYQIYEKLGSGSMGHVYRAHDQRLDTDVVVKVPTLARLEDQRFIERFTQECRFLVQLSHPNVVKVIDVGQLENIPYVVMQYLSGGTLYERSGGRRGKMVPMTPDEVAEWLPNIAKALDFMHSRHFIHRDVKPENILYDDHDNPYLTDFGLSKLQEEDGGMTAAGAVVGSPNYVSPEIVLAREYDGRADQYSLAVTVHECLTGQVPFSGGSPSATLVMHTSEAAPALCDLDPDLGVDLSRIVLKALQKNPEKRFPSCTDFAGAFLHSIGLSTGSGSSIRSGVHQPPRKRQTQPAKKQADISRETSDSRKISRKSAINPPAKRRRIRSQSFDSQQLPPRRNSSRSGSRSSTSSRRSNSSGGRSNASGVIQYVVTKVSRGQPGRVLCPQCDSLIKLKFKHAGQRGVCKTCESRLLISDDLTTLKQIKPARSAVGVAADAQRVNISKGQTANDFVLGTSLFGIELNLKVAMVLAVILIGFVIGITIYTTNTATEQKLEREKQLQELLNSERDLES